MKEKQKEIVDSRITGFFNKETEFKGDLKFKGSFRIDGHFKGKVISDAVLIIGKDGQVEADIKVGTIIVNGYVKGNIHASERAEINANGRITGTLVSPKLQVEEGAFLEAACHTTNQTSPPESKESTLRKGKSD